MKRAVAVIAIGLITACSSTPANYRYRSHVVRPGETLYSIGWRYGVDYQSLAAWNGLSDPSLIYVGQRIRLTPPAGGTAVSDRRSPVQAAASRNQAASTDLPAPEWQWPTDGEVVSAFGNGEAIASGIGIGGREGQPIYAAAAGRVVYAGSGLIGYGQLVIIKHNDTFLSAYGHNRRLLVRQGQEVRRGERIADMGLGPDRGPRLHFEIRRNGTPVNPLPLLGRN